MKLSRDLVVGLVLVVVAVPLLSFRSQFGGEWGDEGIFIGGAERVLAGETIYRDFQHNYPPGRSFTLAALLVLFGEHMSVVRGLWVAFHALAVGFAFLAARRVTSTPGAVVVGLCVMANSVFQNKSAELFLAAAVLVVLLRAFEGRGRDFTAGLALAFLGHFRHDVAVFGVLLFPVALALSVYCAEGRDAPLLTAVRRRLFGAWPFLLGLLVAATPFTVYLVANDAFVVALRELTLSGFVANQYLSRPFPPLVLESGLLDGLLSQRAVYYFTPLTYVVAVALVGRSLRAGGERATRGACVLLIALLGSLLFVQVLPRSDIGHLNKALVPAQILGIYLVEAALRAVRRWAGARRWLAVAGVLVTVSFVTSYHVHYGYYRQGSLISLLAKRRAYAKLRFPRGEVRIRRNQMEIWRAVIDSMRPYAGREDAYLVTYPAGAALNFLCDLPNPLPYDTLRPGELAGIERGDLQPNHPEVLAEIERTIRKARPRFLLDIGEGTNPEICERIETYASTQNFLLLKGRRIAFYKRDEP